MNSHTMLIVFFFFNLSPWSVEGGYLVLDSFKFEMQNLKDFYTHEYEDSSVYFPLCLICSQKS